METPDMPLRFFDLPAELRNRIYEHIFRGVKVDLDPVPTLGGLDLNDVAHHPQPPGILVTCKQAYSEGTSIFYAESNFFAYHTDHLIEWLKNIGPVRQHQLNHIEISSRSNTYLGWAGHESLLTKRLLKQGNSLSRRRNSQIQSLRDAGLDNVLEKLKTRFVLDRFPGTVIRWTVEPVSTANEMIEQFLENIKDKEEYSAKKEEWWKMLDALERGEKLIGDL